MLRTSAPLIGALGSMIGRYKKSILHALSLIERLRRGPYDELAALKELQLFLIRRITHIEGRIRHTKCQLRNADSPHDQLVCEVELRSYREILHLFRSIGDCIAFIFVSSWDIKPFSHGRRSGFISGKSGFKLEVAVLKRYIDSGFPCLLADLTNTILHGDLLIFNKVELPEIVEVKSGKISGRDRKQIRRLNDLNSYLRTDVSSSFPIKGQNVTRRPTTTPATYHTEALQNAASEAYRTGSALVEVENGLRYLVQIDDDYSAIDSSIVGFKEPVVVYLNLHKFDQKPAPYIPLIISLGRPEYSWDFYSGRLHIIVIIDFAIAKETMQKRGMHLQGIDADPNVLRIDHARLDRFEIAKALFFRVAYELLSYEWLINSCAEHAERAMSDP